MAPEEPGVSDACCASATSILETPIYWRYIESRDAERPNRTHTSTPHIRSPLGGGDAFRKEKQGFRNTPKAIEERQAGVAFHEVRAEAARKADHRQAV